MKQKFCFVFCILTLFFASVIYAGEWYSGGTLHDATLREWYSASYQNRLATSADFIAAVKRAKDMKQLKERAIELEHYITTVATDPVSHGQKVKDIAVIGIVTLGFEKSP